jgi:hypothetical protein
MAKFAHNDVLDQGPNLIKTACTKMILVSAYTAGDSYATIQTNKLAEVTMAAGDFTLSSSGSNRLLTVGSGKTAAASASAAGTPDLHIAFTDGSAKVLWVTDETTNQAVVATNTINFPAPVYTSNQPT